MTHREDTNCPRCGRPYPPSEPPTRLFVGGLVRQQVVNAVLARPDGISRSELMDAVYSESTGERVNARTLAVHVHIANMRLSRQGFRIVATGGHGSRYYLEKLSGDPVNQSA